MNSSRGRSGQFIVLAALVISIILLSSTMIIYESLTYRQRLRHRGYMEMARNIDEDFKRALTRALVEFTWKYSLTGNLSHARASAYEFLSSWKAAAARAYAGLGLQLEIKSSKYLLQTAKTLQGKSIPEMWVYHLANIYWNKTQSLSAAYASISLNISGLGFYGWGNPALIALNVTVNLDSISINNTHTSFSFIALRENQEPATGLNPASTSIHYHDGEKWAKAEVTNLEYEGGGAYTITFKPSIPDKDKPKIILRLADSRGILVTASTNP